MGSPNGPGWSKLLSPWVLASAAVVIPLLVGFGGGRVPAIVVKVVPLVCATLAVVVQVRTNREFEARSEDLRRDRFGRALLAIFGLVMLVYFVDQANWTGISGLGFLLLVVAWLLVMVTALRFVGDVLSLVLTLTMRARRSSTRAHALGHSALRRHGLDYLGVVAISVIAIAPITTEVVRRIRFIALDRSDAQRTLDDIRQACTKPVDARLTIRFRKTTIERYECQPRGGVSFEVGDWSGGFLSGGSWGFAFGDQTGSKAQDWRGAYRKYALGGGWWYWRVERDF